MLIVGNAWRYVRKPDGLRLTKRCSSCGREALFVEVVPTNYLTLFFVPLIPADRDKPLLECTNCRKRFEPTPSDFRTGLSQRGANAPAKDAPPERVVLACPRCDTRVRVPRTADRLRVTCTGCRERFTVVDGAVEPAQ